MCDTDPLKLHYSWCLLQIGVTDKSQWELQLQTTRQAVLERKLGFADAYFVKIIDPVVARRQSDADTSRLRSRFDLHVQLQPTLITWYRHLDDVLGGRVHWELANSAPHFDAIAPNDLRYGIEAFDAFRALLDK
ncbi:hypothetical protein [Phyllobacterium ifriqiyense]|uniref:hypothetical protein n=1 Tax=Phyllobacterium ifriqiyense TaxID=314238 RepID=UPI00339682C4